MLAERAPRSARQARWWGGTRRCEKYANELKSLRHKGLWASTLLKSVEQGKRIYPFTIPLVDMKRAAVEALAEERARIGSKRRAAPPTCLEPEQYAQYYAPLPGQLAVPATAVPDVPYVMRRAADQAARRDALAVWEALSAEERAPFEELLGSRVKLACAGLVLTAWHLVRGPYVATHKETATLLTAMGISCEESTVAKAQQRLARLGFYHVEWNIVRRPHSEEGRQLSCVRRSQLGNTLLPGRRLLHVYAAARLAMEGGERAEQLLAPVVAPAAIDSGSDFEATHTLPPSGGKDQDLPPAPSRTTPSVPVVEGARPSRASSPALDGEEHENAPQPPPGSVAEALGEPPPTVPTGEVRRSWPGHGARLQRELEGIATAQPGEAGRHAIRALEQLVFGPGPAGERAPAARAGAEVAATSANSPDGAAAANAAVDPECGRTPAPAARVGAEVTTRASSPDRAAGSWLEELEGRDDPLSRDLARLLRLFGEQ